MKTIEDLKAISSDLNDSYAGDIIHMRFIGAFESDLSEKELTVLHRFFLEHTGNDVSDDQIKVGLAYAAVKMEETLIHGTRQRPPDPPKSSIILNRHERRKKNS